MCVLKYVVLQCFFLHLDHRRVLARLPGGFISGPAAYPAPQLLPGHHAAHHRGCYSRAERQRILSVQSTSKEIAVFVSSSIPQTVSCGAVTNTERIKGRDLNLSGVLHCVRWYRWLF